MGNGAKSFAVTSRRARAIASRGHFLVGEVALARDLDVEAGACGGLAEAALAPRLGVIRVLARDDDD